MKHLLLLLALLPLSCLFAQPEEWEIISHYPTDNAIHDVVFLDESTGFMATEDGLYQSQDGGETWDLNTQLAQSYWLIDAKDETVVSIELNGNASFSNNGGQFWNAVQLPLCFSSAHVLGQDTIVLLGKDEMLITTNGGEDWQADLGPLIGSPYCPDYSQVLSLETAFAIKDETLYKKSEEMAPWEEVEVLSTEEFKTFVFKNDSVGVASLNTGNLRLTEDGGESWSELDENLTASYDYAEYHPNGIYLFASESGRVAWSTDDGESWHYHWLIEGYFSNDDIERVGFQGEIMWVVGKHGSIYTNSSGGEDDWETEFSTRWNISHISPTSDGHLFFSAENNFLKYENSIADFSSHILEEFPGAYIDDFEMINQDRGFLVTSSGQLMVTGDGSETWQDYESGGLSWDNLNYIEFLNENIGYHSQYGFHSFYKTENGGESWSPVLDGSLRGEIRIVDESVVFIADEDFDITTIYRSVDGGDSWDEMSTFENPNLRDFYFLNESIGFAITASEFLKTVDGGETWVLSTGPEDALGFQQILFLNEQVGFLWNSATGASLYSTSNGGETWIDEGLSNMKVIEKDNEYVYAAGNRGKIYRRTISALLSAFDNQEEDALHTFPNPAYGFVNISLGKEDWERIEIFDLNGRVVYESAVHGSELLQISLSSFQNGLYLLKLISNERISTGKFVVNRLD